MTISGTPWRITDKGADAVDAAVIVNNSGGEVLGTSEWVRVDATDLADMVLAVNAHDALVAALESVRKGVPDVLRRECLNQVVEDALALARK